jgi:hypothetical protein
MLDVKRPLEVLWDKSLKPVTGGGEWPEEFTLWWKRNEDRLSNLHPQIAEQWIYRHWSTSPFRFLELRTLCWRMESWSTEAILAQIYMVHGGPLVPEFDYQVMQQASDGPRSTANNWHNGTWNMPLLVLETPSGIDSYEGPLSEVRFILIEGSKRMRYLNALHARAEATGPHPLYILNERPRFPSASPFRKVKRPVKRRQLP